MLEGGHCPGIGVQVRINLDRSDAEAASFEEEPDATGGDAFAEAADDSAGDEDVLHCLRQGKKPMNVSRGSVKRGREGTT